MEFRWFGFLWWVSYMLEWCKHSRKAHVQYQVYIQKIASCQACLGISVLNREMIGVEVISPRFLRPDSWMLGQGMWTLLMCSGQLLKRFWGVKKVAVWSEIPFKRITFQLHLRWIGAGKPGIRRSRLNKSSWRPESELWQSDYKRVNVTVMTGDGGKDCQADRQHVWREGAKEESNRILKVLLLRWPELGRGSSCWCRLQGRRCLDLDGNETAVLGLSWFQEARARLIWWGVAESIRMLLSKLFGGGGFRRKRPQHRVLRKPSYLGGEEPVAEQRDHSDR